MIRWIVLLALLANTTGCAAIGEVFRNPEDTVVVSIEPDPLYEDLVDYYVELCAVSQYRPLERPIGGSPGHAVMYLKGACRDEAAGYPRLRPCKRNEIDTWSHEHGAGISVNRWFKNVNWVAVPGKRLFFDGNLRRYETLDEAHFQAQVDAAIDLGVYDGIELHPIPEEDEPPSVREFAEIHSIGTDYALRFGRTVFCTRVPMDEPMLRKVMDYLNDLNDLYHEGEVDYEWSGYSDNCVHTLHNAIAAAGIWKPKSVRAIKVRQFFNLAIPANTFVNLAFLINEFPLEDFKKVRGDERSWNTLVNEGWLPTGPGTVVRTMAVHQQNELYDTKYRMFLLEGWFTRGTTKRAVTLLSDGRYSSLDANLRYFKDRYERILAEREDPDLIERTRGADYLRDREIYYDYIERERGVTTAAIERLVELDRIRDEITNESLGEWYRRLGRGTAPPERGQAAEEVAD
jgi:hypothetical protein